MVMCELCGKKTENLVKAIVEGGLLSVCGECANFGKVVEITKPVISSEIEKPRMIRASGVDEVDSIVEDYAQLIKKAREREGLKQEEVALKLAEKDSLISNVESGHMVPSIKLARKFEQFFRINLIEKVKETKSRTFDLSDSNLTIGDLLKMKKE